MGKFPRCNKDVSNETRLLPSRQVLVLGHAFNASNAMHGSHISPISCRLVWKGVPHEVNLPDQHRTSNNHRDGNDGHVEACEIAGSDVDVLAPQDIPPQESGQRGAEGGAEGPVVDTESHAVDGGPKGSVGDRRHSGLLVDEDPGLQDSANEDGGANVGTRKLAVW